MTRPDAVEKAPNPPERTQPEKRKAPAVRVQRREIRSPIIGERRIKPFEFLFRRLPVTSRVAHVLVTSAGRRKVCGPEEQPTTGELLWGGYRMAYDVDLGIHVTQLEATSPSKGDMIAFRAAMDLIWKVEKPEKVVLAGVDDVRLALAPFLLQHLRTVTREHQITVPQEAESHANAYFREHPVGVRFGLSVEVFVRLAMDEPTLNHDAIQRKVKLFRDIIAMRRLPPVRPPARADPGRRQLGRRDAPPGTGFAPAGGVRLRDEAARVRRARPLADRRPGPHYVAVAPRLRLQGAGRKRRGPQVLLRREPPGT